MPGDDLKQYIHSNHDFYALLDVEPGASEELIRRGYRKAALKSHPDKVGASQENLDRFHLLSIANEVLSDPTVRELYDNTRRAREEKKAREAAFQGKRKTLIEELERREAGANKRKRDEENEEAQLEREIKRLADDSRRRIRELEEKRAQEAADEAARHKAVPTVTSVSEDTDDRSVIIRYRKTATTSTWDVDKIKSLFSRNGKVENVVIRETRKKPPGEKHKQDYFVAVVEYATRLAAHAAVTEFISEGQLETIEGVSWPAGKEPQSKDAPKFSFHPAAKREGSSRNEAAQGKSNTSSWDAMMLRLKEAEKRRLTALDADNGTGD